MELGIEKLSIPGGINKQSCCSELNGDFDDAKSVVPPKNLEELVAKLRQVFDEDRVNVDYVKALLSSYTSKPRDWRQYAKFDRHRYTRNLVDTGNGKYNLIALCWGEGHGSSIHDHSDSHCFVKMLDGELKETMFDWPENGGKDHHVGDDVTEEEAKQMLCKDQNTYYKDQVTYINDSMGLHRMENPSNADRTVSLHLYVPPFQECQTFDERTGKAQQVCVTFWSQYGKRTPFRVDVSPERKISSGCCSGAAQYQPENN